MEKDEKWYNCVTQLQKLYESDRELASIYAVRAIASKEKFSIRAAEDQVLKFNTIKETVEKAINIVRRNYT